MKRSPGIPARRIGQIRFVLFRFYLLYHSTIAVANRPIRGQEISSFVGGFRLGREALLWQREGVYAQAPICKSISFSMGAYGDPAPFSHGLLFFYETVTLPSLGPSDQSHQLLRIRLKPIWWWNIYNYSQWLYLYSGKAKGILLPPSVLVSAWMQISLTLTLTQNP